MFHVKPPSESCVICWNKSYSQKLICQDYTVSNEKFGIFACDNCGFQITSPRPSETEIGKYYQSENYVSHSNKSFGLMSIAYRLVRRFALNQKYQLLKPFISGKKLSDIGCGTGAFLAFMNAKGMDGIGVEPDETARKNAEKLFQVIPKTEAYLNEVEKNSFDLITMWHVMEHVYFLEERIKTLYEILKTDGTVCIAVPNPESYDAQFYKEHWAAYDVPRHLYHFRPKDIEALMQKQGFRLVKMIPMKFDAFYVSMLSEKYVGSSLSFFKGAFRGLLSNLKAKNGYYSSQIYLFRK